MDEEALQEALERMRRYAKKHPIRLKYFDEDYYCHCLNCGRTVILGPECCDNRETLATRDAAQKDAPTKEKTNENI